MNARTDLHSTEPVVEGPDVTRHDVVRDRLRSEAPRRVAFVVLSALGVLVTQRSLTPSPGPTTPGIPAAPVVLGGAPSAADPAGFLPLVGQVRSVHLRQIAQIGGPSFAVARQGQRAYLGVGPRVVVIDVSDPTTPAEIGQSPILPRVVRDIVVAGDRAYVAADRAGVYVLDVSDPARIAVLGSYDTESQAMALALSGDLAFVAASKDGLLILDTTEPTAPRLVGRFPPSERLLDIALADRIAYLVDRNHALMVLDVRDPTRPTEIGHLDSEGHIEHITLGKDHLFATTDREGFVVVSVADPVHPTIIATAPIVAECTGDSCSPPDVVVIGDTAYVTGDDAPVSFDVVDPVRPRPMNVAAGGVGDDDSHAVLGALTVADGIALIARDAVGGLSGAAGGMAVFDVTRPADPREIGRFETPGQLWWPSLAGLTNRPELVYGNYRVDVTTPSAPRYVGLAPFDALGEVATAGDVVYATGWWGDVLRVFDLADPVRTVEVGRLKGPVSRYDWGEVTWGGDHLAVAGGRAFVAGGMVGWGNPEFGVVDVNDPASPRLLGTLGYGTDELEANAERVAASPDGRYAYLAEGWTDGDVISEDWTGHLQVVDVLDPSAPRVVGTIAIGERDGVGGDTNPWPGGASDMVVRNGLAYVAAELAGLRVIDVRVPDAPREVGFLDFGNDRVRRVALDWPYAFIAVGKRVVAVDVREPTAPRPAAAVDVPGEVRALTVYRGAVWAAMEEAGLFGLELAP